MDTIVVDTSEFSFEHRAVRVRITQGSRDDGIYVKVYVSGFGPSSEPPWPPLELDTLGPYPTIPAAFVAAENYARRWIDTFSGWRPKRQD